MPKLSFPALAALVILVLAGGYALVAGGVIDRWSAPAGDGAEAPDHEMADSIGGPFTLVDQSGAVVTETNWPGKYLLVFFGFTYCPDVCPTTLTDIAAAMKLLGPKADKLQPLLISVDPERDTPAVLASYTAAFDPRIIGLTGSQEQVTAVTQAYRAFAQRVGEGEAYTLQHSVLVYLMSPKGRLKAVLSYDMEPAKMAETIAAIIR